MRQRFFHSSHSRSGFTLVEMSIVMAVIGLVAGGIVIGRSMIRGGELRATITQYQRYTLAVRAFEDAYGGLPGDITNATSYWGAADAGDGIGSDCFYTESTDQSTCNGDGNGQLYDILTYSFEPYRFWQQLANAKLVDGRYTGAPTNNPITANTARYASNTDNIPAGKFGNTGWFVYYLSTNANQWGQPVAFKNQYVFGGMEATDITESGVINPKDAWEIDKKIDDGKPAYGEVWSNPSFTNCTDTVVLANASTAMYDFSKSSGCVIYFRGP